MDLMGLKELMEHKDEIKHFIENIPQWIKASALRTISSPKIVSLSVFVLLGHFILDVDHEALIVKVKAYYRAARKWLLEKKSEPQAQDPVPQPEQPMEDEPKTSESVIRLAAERALQNLTVNQRIEYLLSVTPSQYRRDTFEIVDTRSIRSLANPYYWWSNSTIATDHSSNANNDIDDNFDVYGDLTEEEKKQLISSPSIEMEQN